MHSDTQRYNDAQTSDDRAICRLLAAEIDRALPEAENKIRHAHPVDSPALTALAHRAKASWGYPSDWIERWREELTLHADYLETHRGFVAETDGELLGLIVLEQHEEHWELAHVWIDPVRQKQGIGRRLVEHALATAWEIERWPVRVLSDPHAEPFYLHLGAVRVGIHAAPMPGAAQRFLPVLEFWPDRASPANEPPT